MVDTVMGVLGFDEQLRLFGVTLVGVSGRTALKVLLSILLFVLLSLFTSISRAVMRLITGPAGSASRFWTKQSLQLFTAVVAVLALFSVWVTPGTDLTEGVGLVTAGLAFALQKAIASLAGYFVILRGRVFAVGDRIAVGGVRGDVMSLGFLRTTVMEMGSPSSMAGTETGNWVPSRQFTGRVVTVSNGVIFDEAVYNYTRGFPFLWEELSLKLPFDVDLRRVDTVFHACADRHTRELSDEAMASMQRMSRIRGRCPGVRAAGVHLAAGGRDPRHRPLRRGQSRCAGGQGRHLPRPGRRIAGGGCLAGECGRGYPGTSRFPSGR
ncbi:mechanosensitive ion channel family protein [Dietzia maris]